MILPSLPNECFINIFFFLDKESLYKCLFVSRYYCKLSIPRIWRNPFKPLHSAKSKSSLIDILLACLDEEEISFLIPFAINFNNQSPLFEYGRFVRKFNHKFCIDYIEAWFNSINEPFDYHYDFRVQNLINVIYHKIMRQGSNLQELKLYSNRWTSFSSYYLPKAIIFTTYNKPGITNLRSIHIDFGS